MYLTLRKEANEKTGPLGAGFNVSVGGDVATVALNADGEAGDTEQILSVQNVLFAGLPVTLMLNVVSVPDIEHLGRHYLPPLSDRRSWDSRFFNVRQSLAVLLAITVTHPGRTSL